MNKKWIEILLAAVYEASKKIMEVYQTKFDVEIKSDRSPVTLADKLSSQIITKFLVQTGIPILSEEEIKPSFDKRKNFSKIYTTHLSTDAADLYELDLTETVALIFGNEHSGCSDDIIGMADGNFIIPQVGIIKSLNISVACAVSLYEAYRQKHLAGHFNNIKLTGESLQHLKTQWGFKG